jgi:hypothetical protein
MWWTLLPNQAIGEYFLIATAQIVSGYVFPLAILAVMIREAIRGPRLNRLARWLLVSFWAYLIVRDTVYNYAPSTDPLLAAEVLSGVTDQAIIPALVVLILVRTRRAEHRAREVDE